MRGLIRAVAALAILTASVAVDSVVNGTPASADGSITIYRTQGGCETVIDYGVGLQGSGSGTIEVPDGPGPVVAAFAVWAGQDDTTPNDIAPGGDRADSTLTINAVEVVGIQPDGEAGVAPSGLPDTWYAWYADVGPDGYDLVNGTGAGTLNVSSYDSDVGRYNNGLSLVVVYSVEPCEVPSLVEVRAGVDYYWQGLPDGEGVTLPIIYNVAPIDTDRTARFFINHAGTDSLQTECRGDAIWILAGSGTPPDNIVTIDPDTGAGIGANGGVEAIDDPFGSDALPCVLEANPAPDAPYEIGHPYPGGAADAPYRVTSVERDFQPEWTSLRFDMIVPAGSAWVMFQLESEADQLGESGASVGGGPFVLSPPASVVLDLEIDVELAKSVSLDPAGPFTDEVVGTVGGTVFWEVTVEAKSESPDGVVLGSASGVTVTDIAPVGVTLVSATGDGSVDIATGIWTIGDLAAGSSATVVLESTIDTVGRFVNLADVASHVEDDIDSTPGNGQAEEDDDDSAAVSASLIDVELTKTVDGEAGPVDRERGDTITYSVVVEAKAATDDGVALSDVTGLTVNDVLPSAVTFVSATGDGTYDASTGVWTIGDLVAGSSATIDMVVTINDDAPLEFINSAEVVTHDQPDIDSTPGNGPQDPTEDDDAEVTVKVPTVESETEQPTTTTTTTTTTPPDSSEELPVTGVESGDLGWLGLLVLILGANLVLMATSLDRLVPRRRS